MLAVPITYLHAVLSQLYFCCRAIVFNQVTNLAFEAFNDLIHAADGLEERGLIIKVLLAVKAMPPELGIEQVLQSKPRPWLTYVSNDGRIFAQRVSLRAVPSRRTRFSGLQIAKDREQPQQFFLVGSIQALVKTALHHGF